MQANKPNIGVVLRAYNNPLVASQLNRVIETGMVDQVAVVTNIGRNPATGRPYDPDGFTQNLVSDVLAGVPPDKARPDIQVIGLSNYGWSRALNAGVTSLLSKNEKPDYVWMLSNEVDFKGKQGLEALVDGAARPDVSVAFTLYDAKDEQGAPVPVHQQPSYQVPRNTCSLWKTRYLSDIQAQTGYYFDPARDAAGGMEDYDASLMIYARLFAFRQKCVPAISREQATVIIKGGDNEAFQKKMLNERAAMASIDTHFLPELAKKYRDSILDLRQPEAAAPSARAAWQHPHGQMAP